MPMETVTLNQPDKPKEASEIVTSSETNSLVPENNSELSEEASASETEPQTHNQIEQPAKRRKRKKKKKQTHGIITKTTNSPSTPESLPVPEPTTDTTLEPKEEQPSKSAKILIRGLPVDFKIEDISLEIEKSGITSHRIIQFKKRVGGAYRLLPLFLVITPLANQQKAHSIQSIMQIPISTEKFRGGSRPIQCFRCQSYGHTQRSCANQPRCMKCADFHYSYQCEKDRNSPAKCCNCDGNHTSNFTGCEARPSGKSQQSKDTPASTDHRLVSLVKELQELPKNHEVTSLLQSLLNGVSPSQ
nr:uncharacterized protein LOC107455862 [Parasteatoda tepidariorum]